MRKFVLPMMIAASLSLAAPVRAEPILGDLFNGLANNLLGQELDKQAFISAQSANTVTGYRSYLAKYPNGIYRTNAERALAQLGASVGPGTTPLPPNDGGGLTAAQREAALGLTYAQKVNIQRQLTALGYSTHGTDGVWGYNTRNAIANWQSNNRQTATSYLTSAQVDLLLGQSGPVVSPPPTGNTGGSSGNYSAAQVEAGLSLSRTDRIDIQQQLTKIGYNAGVADGLWGSNTRTAIGRWQTANRMSATGYVTGPQVRQIASQAGAIAGPKPPSDGVGNAALEERLLNLSSSEKTDLQRRLTHLGYNTYGAGGIFDTNSRSAIGRWQSDEGIAVTGYFTADQVRTIRVETGN